MGRCGTSHAARPATSRVSRHVEQTGVFCVYRGSTDSNLFWTRLSGTSWNGGAPTGQASAEGPGLIAGRYKNGIVSQLMCVYRG